MRKQECIHVHALLVEVAHYLIDRREISAETLAGYRDLDTRSSSVHRSKADHRDAIMMLATAIETSLEPAADDTPERTERRRRERSTDAFDRGPN